MTAVAGGSDGDRRTASAAFRNELARRRPYRQVVEPKCPTPSQMMLIIRTLGSRRAENDRALAGRKADGTVRQGFRLDFSYLIPAGQMSRRGLWHPCPRCTRQLGLRGVLLSSHPGAQSDGRTD